MICHDKDLHGMQQQQTRDNIVLWILWRSDKTLLKFRLLYTSGRQWGPCRHACRPPATRECPICRAMPRRWALRRPELLACSDAVARKPSASRSAATHAAQITKSGTCTNRDWRAREEEKPTVKDSVMTREDWRENAMFNVRLKTWRLSSLFLIYARRS